MLSTLVSVHLAMRMVAPVPARAEARIGLATPPAGEALPESEALDRIGTIVRFAHGHQIYGEQEPATYLYRLMDGIVRVIKITSEGRRQVVALYTPGELFGFEVGANHTFSAEAVSNVKVRMIKRMAAIRLAAQEEEIAEQLWVGLAHELRRSQQHILQLGKPAQERVASLLLDMARRLPDSGSAGIPISRRDIADYLAVTIETVSRTLTRFKRMAAIASTRKIRVRNSALLGKLSSSAADGARALDGEVGEREPRPAAAGNPLATHAEHL